MSTDGMLIRHATLDQGAADMMKSAKDIQTRLDLLEDDLKPLQGNWHGAAQAAYLEAKATWDRAMAEMIVLLGDAGRAVEQSNAAYLAADARGKARY